MNLEKIGKRNLTFHAELHHFKEAELKQLQTIFKAWITLKNEILKLSSRKPNLNEVISEGALAYFMKCPRLVAFHIPPLNPYSVEGKKITKKKKKLAKQYYGKDKISDLKSKQNKNLAMLLGRAHPSSSFDCYDTKNNLTVQVKATIGSSDSNEEDLTSFDPYDKTVGLKFQKFYFLDFRTMDGEFDVYDIPLPKLLKVQVNSDKKFEETKEIRPRFSVFKHLIDKYNLKPIKHFDIMHP
ncbi:Bsp6I family type II restriction endonuclease [Candidatus Nitrosopelagicus sp.]|nr:Bsp6I family type II restriction endonuclease [Candidatus Nitrosopelagicus sp.]